MEYYPLIGDKQSLPDIEGRDIGKMPGRYEKHHLLWTRADWSEHALPKRVRQMSAFIIDVAYTNHRLIHAMMQPPAVPERPVLLEMESLAVQGLIEVRNKIKHPITKHIGHQLLIASLDEDVAHKLLEDYDYKRYDSLGEPI
jgi:hypothetical protein